MQGRFAVHLQTDKHRYYASWIEKDEYGLEAMFGEAVLLLRRIGVCPLCHHVLSVHAGYGPSPWHEYFGVSALSVLDGHIVE